MNKKWNDESMEYATVILPEVEDMVDEVFVANVGNTLALRAEIVEMMLEIMVENTQYLAELVDLGEYYITPQNEVVKSILSDRDINDGKKNEILVECPECRAQLKLIL